MNRLWNSSIAAKTFYSNLLIVGLLLIIAFIASEVFIEPSATRASIKHKLLVSLWGWVAVALGISGFFAYRIHVRLRKLIELAHSYAQSQGCRSLPTAITGDEIDIVESHLGRASRQTTTIIQDIADEKETANSILRCMSEGVLVLDAAGKILVINEQAKKMFDVPQGREFQDKSFAELCRNPRMISIIQEALTFDFSTDQRYTRDVELEEGQWFRVAGAKFDKPSKQTTGAILVFHDISEIKRFEAIRADFVANVSHELRTPLTAIRGYVETLIQSPPNDPGDSRHFLGIIERNTERLTHLTEDLLALSDLESGKLILNRRPIDIRVLTQRVFEGLWHQAKKKNIQLASRIDDNIAPIFGDFDRLQQLLVNLVDNAVKYTPANGSVTVIATSGQPTDSGRETIQVAVADTGQGIPENDIPRLTERFYRVDKARSRELGGTGLGLAIVKHITQAHNGLLRIESQLNQGTTVSVTLPACEEDKLGHGTILFFSSADSYLGAMAEGFARQIGPQGRRILSAAQEPNEIHPFALQVMREVGVDISNQRARALDSIAQETVKKLIIFGRENNSIEPAIAAEQYEFWDFAEPVSRGLGERELLDGFRTVRDQIRARVELLLRPKDLPLN